MGGMSIEREVSFNSGRTVCDHLDTTTYEVIPLFQTADNKLYLLPWHFLHRGKISDFEHRLEKEAQSIAWDDLKNLIDFVYIAVHGRYAEDGTLQGFLEVLGIPYLGTKVLGSALSMNKIRQKDLIALAGIKVAHGISVTPQEIKTYQNNPELLTQKLSDNNLALPLVIKPNEEGSSLGVSVVTTLEEIIPALVRACSISEGMEQSVLIEEKIEGMEFTCVTLFDALGNPLLLPPTEVVHEAGTSFHDYTQKYMPGRSLKFTPARTSEQNIKAIQETCLTVTKLLEFKTISRIDGFLTKDNKVVIVDPNSLAGMAPSSFLFNQAASVGMSHTDLINSLIDVELHSLGMFVSRAKKTDDSVKKIRVAVLLGGDTNERETSLDSGRNVCYKLSPQKYDILPLFVDSKRELYPLTQKLLVHNATKEIELDLDRSTKLNWHDLPKVADFVFIALHGGAGENGSVQGTLEMLKLPYNGSGIAASALCMDKYKTNNFLAKKGFSVPLNQYVTKQEWISNKQAVTARIKENLPLPVIVKPHNDGCSVGVKKATTLEQISQYIDQVLMLGTADALIEECVVGMELTGGVIGNETPQALPPSQAVSASGVLSIEEKFLPGAGENQTPAPLPQQAIELVQKTLESVYKTIGCSGYCRIDCFYQTAQQSPTGKERVVILEINSLPGLTPATCIFHQAAEIGIKPMDFIDLIVSLGLQKHARTFQSSFIKGEMNEEDLVQSLADSPSNRTRRKTS